MSQCPNSPCPPSKAATGCLLFPMHSSLPTCRHQYCLSEANWNAEKGDFYIGSSLLSHPSVEGTRFEPPLGMSTSSSQDQTPLMSTSGKKTPAWPERSSSLEQDHCPKPDLLTGTRYDNVLFKETLLKYPVTYTFAVTTNSEELAKTTYNLLLWSELVQYSGVVLGLGNQEEPGKRQEWMLTLKIRDPNSGMVTKVTTMLSSMNFGVVSTSLTCSSGLIVIRSLLKLKAPQPYCGQDEFGSLQI